MPLIRYLCGGCSISQWSYFHDCEDSACSLEEALSYLGEYMDTLGEPVHLLGHGTAGMVAAVYAQHHPEKVRTLTLLSVSPDMAHSWIGLYYQLFGRRPCCRAAALGHLAETLGEGGDRERTRRLAALLYRDLSLAFSPHTPLRLTFYPARAVAVPLLVCGSADDVVVPPADLKRWEVLFKAGDRLHIAPQGRHFFHCHRPVEVGAAIQDFWLQHALLDGCTPRLMLSNSNHP
jgi:pimeloyl-ACP methyl ester carboxylesterase